MSTQCPQLAVIVNIKKGDWNRIKVALHGACNYSILYYMCKVLHECIVNIAHSSSYYTCTLCYCHHYIAPTIPINSNSPPLHSLPLLLSSHELILPFLKDCLFRLNRPGLIPFKKHIEEKCVAYEHHHKYSGKDHVWVKREKP